MIGCSDFSTNPIDPPGAPQLDLTPERPTTLDDLVVEVTDDPESSVTRNTYRWLVDGLRAEEYEGPTVPAAATQKGQRWEVVVTPNHRNVDGAEASAAVRIVNAPPQVRLSWETSPASTIDDLVVLAEATDPDDDPVTLTVSWTRDGGPFRHEGLSIGSRSTERGEVWVVTVTPNDGEEDGEPAELSITIDNMVPTVGSVTLGPDPAFTTTDLVATAHDIYDPDDDAVTLSFDWYVGGTLVPDQHGATLDSSFFVKGEEVEVEATPNDGLDDGPAVRSAPLTIQNSPPSATAAIITPPEADSVTDLSCAGEGFFDDDGDPEGYLYAWFINGVEHSAGPSLPSSAFRRGDTVACVVTPFDGEDEGEPVFSSTLTISNAPPWLDEVHIDPEDPRAADTLSVVLGDYADPDGDEVSFSYAWEVDGELLFVDDETLDGRHFGKGQEVVVIVTPTDGMLDGPSVRSEPVTVQNTRPVLTGVSLDPTPAFTRDPLVASAFATDSDGDPISYGYRWFVNGTDTGIVSSTLPESYTSKHDEVSVEATATDGESFSAPLSASTTVVNTPPSIASAVIDPPDPFTNTDLSCSAVGYEDDDGDPATFEYRWTVNGSPAGTGPTLASSAFVRHDTVLCYITPFDGEDHGAEVSSEPIVVRNSPPTITTVTLSPTSPRTADFVSVTVDGAFDLDDDPVTLTYLWIINGTPIDHTGSFLATDFRGGDRIRVTVTPFDGWDEGPSVTSAEITVANTPPVVTALTLEPRPAYTTTDLTAIPAAFDADGDTLTYTFGWYINGDRYPFSLPTLPSSAYVKGHVVYADVTALDGFDASATFTSEPLTIANSAPTTPGTPTLTPTSPTSIEKLICNLGTPSVDPDSDPITYQAEFRRGSSTRHVWAVGTIATLASKDTRIGQSWRCRIRARDDEGLWSLYGSFSAPVIIRSYWDAERRFTTCGNTGTHGPSASQCGDAYTSTPLDGAVTVVEGMQEWTVPITGTYRIWACGAAGMSAEPGRRGGRGACVRGDFPLSAGHKLMIVVGQNGTEDSASDEGNGGGGGGTWVLRDLDSDRWSTENELLLVAGGGAGARRETSQGGCDGRTTLDAGSGVDSPTHDCGPLSTEHRGMGGPAAVSELGSGGGGWLSDGAGDEPWGSGGRGFEGQLLGGSATECGSSTGGFGGGGSGNGCWGGGGGGGYGGGQGGWIAGGGSSYNAGTSTSTAINGVESHGYVTIDLL